MNERTVIVTGASAGIGEACARRFAKAGANLILLARRQDRLESLRDELAGEAAGIRIDAVDVRDRDAVMTWAEQLQGEGVEPDILVNNAGLASGLGKIYEGDFEDWDKMIDTNVKGLLNVTRAILPGMVARDRGHIVNIGSIAGRMAYPGGSVYCATKFAVRALGNALNIDLVGTRVRVSNVDPGATETEFSIVRFHGDKEKAKATYDGFAPLRGDDVADAVHYVVNVPPHVNITDLIIMPTAQRNPYVLDRETPRYRGD